jgi:hypothetical protein
VGVGESVGGRLPGRGKCRPRARPGAGRQRTAHQADGPHQPSPAGEFYLRLLLAGAAGDAATVRYLIERIKAQDLWSAVVSTASGAREWLLGQWNERMIGEPRCHLAEFLDGQDITKAEALGWLRDCAPELSDDDREFARLLFATWEPAAATGGGQPVVEPTGPNQLIDPTALATAGQRHGSGEAPSGSGANPSLGDDGVPWPDCMSAADLARRLNVLPEATRKKLERLADFAPRGRPVRLPSRFVRPAATPPHSWPKSRRNRSSAAGCSLANVHHRRADWLGSSAYSSDRCA